MNIKEKKDRMKKIRKLAFNFFARVFQKEYLDLQYEGFLEQRQYIEGQIEIKKQKDMQKKFKEYKKKLDGYMENGIEERDFYLLRLELKAMCEELSYSALKHFLMDSTTIDRREPFPLNCTIHGKTIEAEIYIIKDVDIKDIPLLSRPFYHTRLNDINSIIQKNGFLFDKYNHRVIYIEDLGIGYVEGGNHSIAVGIILGEGKLDTVTVHRIGKIFEYVNVTDTGSMYYTEDGWSLQIHDIRFAYIYLIGRALHLVQKYEKIYTLSKDL